MKPVQNISARYDAFRLIEALIKAEKALQDARHALIDVKVNLDGSTAPDGLLAEVDRMIHVLYADRIEVAEGGGVDAWDIRSLVLRVGERVCAADVRSSREEGR